MKILLSSYFALPNTGGLWTYVIQLQQGLQALGHEVDILAHHPDLQHYHKIGQEPLFPKQPVEELFKTHLLPRYAWISPRPGKEILRMEMQRYVMEAAMAALDISSYDLYHAQDIISTRALARIKPRQAPLVSTIHGYYSSELLRSGLIGEPNSAHHRYSLAQESIGISSADIAIIPSAWLKNIFQSDLIVQEERLRVVPNGMDIPAFLERMLPATRLEPVKPPDKKVIACVARLDLIKGHSWLLDALASLKTLCGGWVCWLIGDGDERQEIEQKIAELGLQAEVELLGDRSDVPALLVHADLCVLPSLQENCPYSIMEAQTAGRTVIGSEVGGIPEMIQHGKTGFLTPPADSESLCKALHEALIDDPLRERIGAAAEVWGRTHWSRETMLARTVQLYEEAFLQKAQPGPPVKLHQRLLTKWAGLTHLFTPGWRSGLKLPDGHRLPDPAFVRVMRGL